MYYIYFQMSAVGTAAPCFGAACTLLRDTDIDHDKSLLLVLVFASVAICNTLVASSHNMQCYYDAFF